MSRSLTLTQTGHTSSSSVEPGRPAKGKKPVKTRTRDRSPRPEEERFNVGPRATRTANWNRSGGRRQTRSARGERSYEIIDGVPNYPPPSFQEAISTPLLSVCPSTVSLVTSPLASLPPLVIPDNTRIPQESTPMGSSMDTGGNSDSDDSLQIIDEDDAAPQGLDPKLIRSVQQDYLTRRGVQFPSPTRGEDDLVHPPNKPDNERRRPTLDLVAIFDGVEEAPRSPSIASQSRRFLSLSPLRTIFPSRAPHPPDRPHSAHPSPGTSPYSQGGRNTPFFRSTTSLATVSFLRLPLTSGPSLGRSESFLTRRLFSSKGKERTKEPHVPEALEAWEELKKEELDEYDDEGHPQSLMAVVESVTSPVSIKSTTSPTRSVSFTYGAPLLKETIPPMPTVPLPQVNHPPAAPVPEVAQPPPEVHQPNIQPSVHPLSLRDRKTPFIQRPARKTPTPRPPPIYVPPPVTDPIITTVRSRMPPTPPPSQPTIPKPHTAVARPSPLGLESFSLQQDKQDSPEPMPIQAPIPGRPISITSGALTCRCNSPEGQSITIPALSRTPSPLSPDESTTPTRHHYSGRPLPRPPTKTRTHVDSTFAPNEDFAETSVEGTPSVCPVGLLIDLGESLPDVLVSQHDPECRDMQSHSPAPLIDLDSSEDLGVLLTPPAEQGAFPTPPPNITDYPEITDLDMLLSTLSDEAGRSGDDYDVSGSAESWKGASASASQNNNSALNAMDCEGAARDHGIYRPGSPPSRPQWVPTPAPAFTFTCVEKHTAEPPLRKHQHLSCRAC